MNDFSSVIKIDPTQAQRAIAILMKAKITPVLVGGVGCGKTTAVKDFVATLNEKGVATNLITKVLAQMDISNFSLPQEVNRRIHEICAEWIPLEDDAKPDDPYTVIFFDELDRCDQMIQNIILNIILDRHIASRKISDKVIFVGAMNGSSDVYTTPLSKAAVTRVCMLYIQPTTDSYDKWAEKNGISDFRRAFQRFKAPEIIKYDENFEDVSIPVNRSLDACDKVDRVITSSAGKIKTDDIYNALIAGLIGVPGSIEYIGFKRLYEKAETPDVILKDPAKAKVDYVDEYGNPEPSVKYAVLTNVVNYVKDRKDMNLADKAFQFASRFDPEYIMAMSSLLLEKFPDSVACPTYLDLRKLYAI